MYVGAERKALGTESSKENEQHKRKSECHYRLF